MNKETIKAGAWAVAMTLLMAILIFIGSRNLAHFDAALVAYTFATLFAAFGITYRYAMWLQRPPTALYWRRGCQVFFPKYLARNVATWFARVTHEFAFNHFIFKRGKSRWAAHWLIMWGCLIAIAITFPLVFGWIHFETLPGDTNWYRTFVFGFLTFAFPIHSIIGRPAQLGVSFYKDIAAMEEQAKCRRCEQPFASQMHIEDLIEVERKLGFRYELEGPAEHYQWICPKCRRAMLALAQGRLWHS